MAKGLESCSIDPESGTESLMLPLKTSIFAFFNSRSFPPCTASTADTIVFSNVLRAYCQQCLYRFATHISLCLTVPKAPLTYDLRAGDCQRQCLPELVLMHMLQKNDVVDRNWEKCSPWSWRATNLTIPVSSPTVHSDIRLEPVPCVLLGGSTTCNKTKTKSLNSQITSTCHLSTHHLLLTFSSHHAKIRAQRLTEDMQLIDSWWTVRQIFAVRCTLRKICHWFFCWW